MSTLDTGIPSQQIKTKLNELHGSNYFIAHCFSPKIEIKGQLSRGEPPNF